MSADTFRAVIVVLAIFFGVAFLAVFADVTMRHPAINWFFLGIGALAVAEGIAYLLYLLVKYIRGK